MCRDEVGREGRVWSMSILWGVFLGAGGFLGRRKPRAQGFAGSRGLRSSLVRFLYYEALAGSCLVDCAGGVVEVWDIKGRVFWRLLD